MTSIDEYVTRTVDAAPPLSDYQRAQITSFLFPCAATNPGVVTPARPAPPAPSITVHVEPEAPVVVPCAVYRHYDSDDRLLYVGISVDPERRAKSHKGQGWWSRFMARETVTWHEDTASAKSAERAAIEDEHPLFNVSHNCVDNPTIVKYLVANDALDLLFPARR